MSKFRDREILAPRSKLPNTAFSCTTEKVPAGRTPVESTELEFLDVGWPKQEKNPGEKLDAPLVQSSKAKYSLQVKIFEFYSSGRTPVESTE